jgi:hypothetical protein
MSRHHPRAVDLERRAQKLRRQFRTTAAVARSLRVVFGGLMIVPAILGVLFALFGRLPLGMALLAAAGLSGIGLFALPAIYRGLASRRLRRQLAELTPGQQARILVSLLDDRSSDMGKIVSTVLRRRGFGGTRILPAPVRQQRGDEPAAGA